MLTLARSWLRRRSTASRSIRRTRSARRTKPIAVARRPRRSLPVWWRRGRRRTSVVSRRSQMPCLRRTTSRRLLPSSSSLRMVTARLRRGRRRRAPPNKLQRRSPLRSVRKPAVPMRPRAKRPGRMTTPNAMRCVRRTSPNAGRLGRKTRLLVTCSARRTRSSARRPATIRRVRSRQSCRRVQVSTASPCPSWLSHLRPWPPLLPSSRVAIGLPGPCAAACQRASCRPTQRWMFEFRVAAGRGRPVMAAKIQM
mmetsp:Transcript_134259/g.429027  ORF Transcript_134259/g.429027 Transcript_134259/m.429027 type:complete len:253 (-) Transcript_134259:404-1162(-)